MKVSLEVELEDRPGQLRNLLGVFEQANANVISITHLRGRRIENRVPIQIVFTVPEKETIGKMDDCLRKGGYRVISMGKISQPRGVTVGVVGHIIRTKSVEEIIEKVDSLGANVSRFAVNMPSQSGESSALISFEAEEEGVVAKAVEELESLCRKNGLLLIKQVE